MPITQERMLAVLAEAEGAQDALTTLQETVREIIVESGNAGIALASIKNVFSENVVPNMPRCSLERAHFTRVNKRNRTNASYMRAKRAERKGESDDAGR
jgi:hypothetical protein